MSILGEILDVQQKPHNAEDCFAVSVLKAAFAHLFLILDPSQHSFRI